MPISAVQQSDWVLHIYIHSFFNILFHYGLSQEIGYSLLCCTIGPCCLTILNVIVCIYQPQTPSPSLSFPHFPLATTNLISMSVSLFLKNFSIILLLEFLLLILSYLMVSVTEWLPRTLCDSSCRTKVKKRQTYHSPEKAPKEFWVPLRGR